MIQADFFSKTFTFAFSARTSRGEMKTKKAWFIRLRVLGKSGVGECAPLDGLSVERSETMDFFLENVCTKINQQSLSIEQGALLDMANFWKTNIDFNLPSSVLFALETATLSLIHGEKIFDNAFTNGKPIPINGLIWMGDFSYMKKQVDKKIEEGFTCIKIKIGGIAWKDELALLDYIRTKAENITLRVDANGAFGANVFEKLQELTPFSLHSIEQPVPPNHVLLHDVCAHSPVPVALDESLINTSPEILFASCSPSFIVLKPTLHNGLSGCTRWVAEAEKRNIGWWITSALESGVGLNAIAQWCGNYNVSLHQGLGTGQIYSEPMDARVTCKNGYLYFNS